MLSNIKIDFILIKISGSSTVGGKDIKIKENIYVIKDIII